MGRGGARTGGKIFFADEAHFRADAELRSKWVLKGEPAVDGRWDMGPGRHRRGGVADLGRMLVWTTFWR